MFQSNKPSDTQAKAQPATAAASTPAPAPAASRGPAEPSIISADLRVVGDLHCSGDLQVKGNVEGDIRSRSVTIGEGAQVQGSVMAETVHISGSIKGQIEAPKVSVARSGRVQGDIVHQTLAVEAGAFLDGNCRHMDSKAGGVSTVKPAATKPEEKKAASGA